MLLRLPLIVALLVALIAGITDWRSRRIPNWLTVTGAALGLAINTVMFRWPGLKASLLGLALGLLLLLPLVFLRAIGGGDWKLAGSIGACLGLHPLVTVLELTIFIAGIMALALVIARHRLKQTLTNIVHIVGSLFMLHMPGPEVSLDNPASTKIPWGVALALATIIYVVAAALGKIPA